MSLIKRQNSKNWYYLFQINGKRFFASTGTPRKVLAIKIEAKKREDALSEQILGEVKPISLRDALEKYRDSKEDMASFKNIVGHVNKLLGYKLHPKTRERINVHAIASPDTPIHEITTRHVKTLVVNRKANKTANWTIKHELQVLRGAIKLAKELGYKVNSEITWPSNELKVRRGRLRFLTKEEEESMLLKELDPHKGITLINKRTDKLSRQLQDNYDLVVALLDTGMRYNEMAKLPWNAVDISKQTIRVYRNKVDKADTLHMTARLAKIMNRREQNRTDKTRYVFESTEGKPRGYAVQSIMKAIDRAGLNAPEIVREKGGKVTIHTLRHTFASNLVQAGISIAKVSELLGHSSVMTTEIYTHLAPSEASIEAVNVLNQLNKK